MSDPGASAAEALKNRGNSQKAAGDLPGAVESYRQALEAEPNYVAALYNLGLALRELENFEEAEACFRRVLEIDPRDVDALLWDYSPPACGAPPSPHCARHRTGA